MKTVDFYENHGFWWKLQFPGRFKLRNCKNHISNSTFYRTTSNTEIHRFLSEMIDHLPKKVTPIFVLCAQLTHFKAIWSNFIIVYPIESLQDHMTWFLYCVLKLVLSRPFDLILSLCTQLTPFKTIWPDFALCTHLTFFKTIWPNFIIVYPKDSFQDHLPKFIIVYPIDSFQDHLTQFYHSVQNWLLSRPFDLIFVFCTQLTPFKTIWSNCIIVYPNWLFSRPFDLIFALCTQLTPFKTIWTDFCFVHPTAFKTICPDFIIVYPVDSFQHHLREGGEIVLKGFNWVHNDKIGSNSLERSQ